MLELLKALPMKLWENAGVRSALKALAIAVATVVAGQFGLLEAFGLIAK